MSLFGDVTGDPNILYNNMRVYGTILLLLLSIVVFIGVRYVSVCSNCVSILCTVCVSYEYINRFQSVLSIVHVVFQWNTCQVLAEHVFTI